MQVNEETPERLRRVRDVVPANPHVGYAFSGHPVSLIHIGGINTDAMKNNLSQEDLACNSQPGLQGPRLIAQRLSAVSDSQLRSGGRLGREVRVSPQSPFPGGLPAGCGPRSALHTQNAMRVGLTGCTAVASCRGQDH